MAGGEAKLREFTGGRGVAHCPNSRAEISPGIEDIELGNFPAGAARRPGTYSAAARRGERGRVKFKRRPPFYGSAPLRAGVDRGFAPERGSDALRDGFRRERFGAIKILQGRRAVETVGRVKYWLILWCLGV